MVALAGNDCRSTDLRTKIRDSLRQVPYSLVFLAIVITHVNYGVLVVYDYLAFRFAGVPISLDPRDLRLVRPAMPFSYNFGADPGRNSLPLPHLFFLGNPHRPRSCNCW